MTPLKNTLNGLKTWISIKYLLQAEVTYTGEASFGPGVGGGGGAQAEYGAGK